MQRPIDMEGVVPLAYQPVLSFEERDQLARTVREAWVAWALEQPDIADHANWVVPYDQLAERDKEADRRIAEAVVLADRARLGCMPLIGQRMQRNIVAVEDVPTKRSIINLLIDCTLVVIGYGNSYVLCRVTAHNSNCATYPIGAVARVPAQYITHQYFTQVVP